MPDPNMTKLDMPKSVRPTSDTDNFVIRVMPKEFIGKSATTLPSEAIQAPPAPKPEVRPAPVVMVKPIAPVKPSMAKRKRGPRAWVVLLTIGIIFITGMIIGAYFIVQSLKKPIEVVIPVEEPEVEEETEEPTEPSVLITRGKDTDSDGLTDIEEALYRTDFRNPDTDADTYLDGNEVFHLYDPLGFAPSTLLDTGTVVRYEDPAGRFSISYPTKWTLEPTTGGLRLKSATASYFEITSYPKLPDQDLETWYAQTIAIGNGAKDLKSTMSKGGYIGLTSDDERATYLDTGDTVYAFSYQLGEDILVSYMQTFLMVVNSFIVQP